MWFRNELSSLAEVSLYWMASQRYRHQLPHKRRYVPAYRTKIATDCTRWEHPAKRTTSASWHKHLREKYRYIVCRLHSSISTSHRLLPRLLRHFRATVITWLFNCSVSKIVTQFVWKQFPTIHHHHHQSSSSTYICHLVGPLVDPFRSHASRCFFNLLKPNDIYICRTAALISRCYILNIYSTNIHTEYFKHAA